jgi:hypothetical protein
MSQRCTHSGPVAKAATTSTTIYTDFKGGGVHYKSIQHPAASRPVGNGWAHIYKYIDTVRVPDLKAFLCPCRYRNSSSPIGLSLIKELQPLACCPSKRKSHQKQSRSGKLVFFFFKFKQAQTSHLTHCEKERRLIYHYYLRPLPHHGLQPYANRSTFSPAQ